MVPIVKKTPPLEYRQMQSDPRFHVVFTPLSCLRLLSLIEDVRAARLVACTYKLLIREIH